jgi:hypothetical protein
MWSGFGRRASFLMTPTGMSAVCRNSPLPLCHSSPTLSAISRPREKRSLNFKLKLNSLRPITVHGHRPRLGLRLGVGPITVSSLRGLELASLQVGVSACHGQRGRGTGMMCHCASASGISRVDPRKGPTTKYVPRRTPMLVVTTVWLQKTNRVRVSMNGHHWQTPSLFIFGAHLY